MTGGDLTILVALAAGVISFLSPCVLPLVPAYLGQLTAIAVAGRRPGCRAVALARGPPLARLRRGLRGGLHAPRRDGDVRRRSRCTTTWPRSGSSAACSSSSSA